MDTWSIIWKTEYARASEQQSIPRRESGYGLFRDKVCFRHKKFKSKQI